MLRGEVLREEVAVGAEEREEVGEEENGRETVTHSSSSRRNASAMTMSAGRTEPRGMLGTRTRRVKEEPSEGEEPSEEELPTRRGTRTRQRPRPTRRSPTSSCRER